ncbi:urea-proton symporter dur3-like [Plakobranchus ocellatus]|uniref:Urea-proton symporter dur3-like n=1 Tax=Plakobranchus ocellatus TaxID=259542 RepID=A0AAV3ZDN5_9GAST|nr:urea-proton symporter dur3-like [Plakobranchus ocellatus]
MKRKEEEEEKEKSEEMMMRRRRERKSRSKRRKRRRGRGEVRTVLEPYEAALILLLGFGGMSVGLALLYNFIRQRVFGEGDDLDRTFDAGGNVSFSLTAVTVAVQLLWPADLLQSSSVASKYGIAGGFWYSTAVVVNIILFPLLSITFKTRAPGAKTYLQVIKARFGPPAHIVYCLFALLTNVVILSVLIIAGHALFKGLVKDISDELILLIFATLFGSYSFVGGLGSTFYVSYANAVITFIIMSYYIIKLFYLPDEEDLPFGTLDDIYHKVVTLIGPKDNEDRSYLTFWSGDSMIWAVQGVFIAASVTFCDQASWQSRIAAKPMQGVLGFFFATFLWFAIPATLGTTSGIVYLAYSQGGNLSTALTEDDINKGLVTPYIAITALGRGGGVMVLIMFTMLMMATGSGEVMGVSSIIVYDIYQSYVKPFRRNAVTGHCLLCGKRGKSEIDLKPSSVSEMNDIVEVVSNGRISPSIRSRRSWRPEPNGANQPLCECIPVSECLDCQNDFERMIEKQTSNDQYIYVVPKCSQHGQYRLYQAELVRVKSWVLLWVTIGLVPGGLLLVRTGIDLNWIFMTGMIANGCLRHSKICDGNQ